MSIARLPLVILGLSLIASQASASEQSGWFDFAETQIEQFDLQARTGWTADDTPPTASAIECTGDNEEIRFRVDKTGGIAHLSIQFFSGSDERGKRRRGAYLGDVLWLYIDNERFEFRNIAAPDSRFSNFTYSSVDPEQDIILVWQGTPSVRQSDLEPFRPLASIYEQMVTARKIAWSLKSADPTVERAPSFNAKRRYRIDNSGLRPAVDWCRRQVASSAARELPAYLLAQFKARDSN